MRVLRDGTSCSLRETMLSESPGKAIYRAEGVVQIRRPNGEAGKLQHEALR